MGEKLATGRYRINDEARRWLVNGFGIAEERAQVAVVKTSTRSGYPYAGVEGGSGYVRGLIKFLSADMRIVDGDQPQASSEVEELRRQVEELKALLANTVAPPTTMPAA